MINLKYMILNVSEINQINFSEVLETSVETIMLSANKQKTFVKWNSEIIPASVNALTTKEGPYTNQEIVNILATPEWTGETPK